MSNWTIFSNHGHVLFCLSRDSEARLRDVATDVGITERAVQKIVRDLQDGGMITVTKSGRRNSYRIHKKQRLRHELEATCKLRDLIRVVNREPKPAISDSVLVNKTEKSAEKNSKPEQTQPGRLTPVIKEPDEPELSNSIEKQQRSLF